MSTPSRWPITAESAAGMVAALFPKGLIWSRRPEGRVWQYSAAVGLTFVRLRERCLDLLDEADPRTATELLSDWEAALEPYDCVPQPAALADRRVATAAKLAAYGGQSAAYLEGVAAAAGYDVAVRKPHPWRVDASPVDAPVLGPAWIWAFEVVTSLGTPTPWRCGTHGVDEPLADHAPTPLACLVEQLKPAHGTAHFTTT